LNILPRINFCGVLTVLCYEIRHCAKRQNGVGIAGAISTAAIPPTGAIFLGGWALSTGLGSAVGAAGI